MQAECQGEQAIFDFLKTLNDIARLAALLGEEFPFGEYTNVDHFPVIEVAFASLDGMDIHKQGTLTLLDTPGPNEAGQSKALTKVLAQQLRQASAVLLVTDYTQINSEADDSVRDQVKQVANLMPQGGLARLYAVVNKVDQAGQHDGQDEGFTALRSRISDMLGQHKGGGMLLSPDRIYPVSALHGYLAGRALQAIGQGHMDIHTPWAEPFLQLVLGLDWREEFEDYRSQGQEGMRMLKPKAERLLRRSRMDTVHSQVISRLQQNAGWMALQSALVPLGQCVDMLCNVLESGRYGLAIDLKQLKADIAVMQQQVDAVARMRQEIREDLLLCQGRGQGKLEQELEQSQQRIMGAISELTRAETDAEAKEAAYRQQERDRVKAKDLLDINLFKLRSTFSKWRDGRKEKKLLLTSREEAEQAVQDMAQALEAAVQHTLGVLPPLLTKHIQETTEHMQARIQQHVEEVRQVLHDQLPQLEIVIRPPQTDQLQLDIPVDALLQGAVSERQRTVTRKRRQSGWWGNVCRFFDTDDWGWEEYEAQEKVYRIDMDKVVRQLQQVLQIAQEGAVRTLQDDIIPALEREMEQAMAQVDEQLQSALSGMEHAMSVRQGDQQQVGQQLQVIARMQDEAQCAQVQIESLRDMVRDASHAAGRVA